MSEIILDGTGKGYKAKVDKGNRVHTFSITESEQDFATLNGDSYNINTGNVNISGSSALLYFKNDEDTSFIVDAIALGFSTGSNGATPSVTLKRNPTAGTIIDNATNVDMNESRNFGSSKTLKTTTLAYKGNSGNTFTDGSDIAQFYTGLNGRLFATINFELPRGSSLGIHVNPELTTGSVRCYAAIIGYVREDYS